MCRWRPARHRRKGHAIDSLVCCFPVFRVYFRRAHTANTHLQARWTVWSVWGSHGHVAGEQSMRRMWVSHAGSVFTHRGAARWHWQQLACRRLVIRLCLSSSSRVFLHRRRRQRRWWNEGDNERGKAVVRFFAVRPIYEQNRDLVSSSFMWVSFSCLFTALLRNAVSRSVLVRRNGKSRSSFRFNMSKNVLLFSIGWTLN